MLPVSTPTSILRCFIQDKVNLSEFNQPSKEWEDILKRKINNEKYFAFFNEVKSAASKYFSENQMKAFNEEFLSEEFHNSKIQECLPELYRLLVRAWQKFLSIININ